MDHLAIMKKSWGLTEKILQGEKTVESRWYKQKRSPWDRIKVGDTIYFKDSGEPVSAKAKVIKVFQFDNLDFQKTERILSKYGKYLGISDVMPEIKNYVLGKNYCIFIFFSNVEEIKPFEINKTGYGLMTAWISLENIDEIKIMDNIDDLVKYGEKEYKKGRCKIIKSLADIN